MKLTKLTIALYLGLVFSSGIVLGVFGDRVYNAAPVQSRPTKPNPEEFRKKMVAEYQGRLKLTDQQIQQLNIILDETRSRFHEAHQKMDPELAAIQHEQRDKIRQMLKPEQRDEYEKMLQEREKRQKEHGERRGGPGI
jgi:Spy/CpxP family protein refolding chaperone